MQKEGSCKRRIVLMTLGLTLSVAAAGCAENSPARSRAAGTVTASAAPSAAPPQGAGGETPAEDGVQLIRSSLAGGRYPAITVKQNIPVKWIIDAPKNSINGCNGRMRIPEYGIEYAFKAGENVIEFTPNRSGKFTYACWMNMVRSSITVVENPLT